MLAFSLPLLGTVSLHLLRESGLVYICVCVCMRVYMCVYIYMSLCAFPNERVLLSVGDLHKYQAKGEGKLKTLFEKTLLSFIFYIIILL